MDDLQFAGLTLLFLAYTFNDKNRRNIELTKTGWIYFWIAFSLYLISLTNLIVKLIDKLC